MMLRIMLIVVDTAAVRVDPVYLPVTFRQSIHIPGNVRAWTRWATRPQRWRLQVSASVLHMDILWRRPSGHWNVNDTFYATRTPDLLRCHVYCQLRILFLFVFAKLTSFRFGSERSLKKRRIMLSCYSSLKYYGKEKTLKCERLDILACRVEDAYGISVYQITSDLLSAPSPL